MVQHLHTAKSRVEYLLNKFPETRSSDKLLWLAYLCSFHGLHDVIGDSYPEFEKLILNKKTPPMETVRRVRQKLQEDGKFVDELRPSRMAEAENVREYLR